MKSFYILAAFTFSFIFLKAAPLSSRNDPFKDYEKAKNTHHLEDLSLQQRIQILNSVLGEINSDTTFKVKSVEKEKADIIEDVITTTPQDNVQQLFNLMGTDYVDFQSKFRFLPF